MHACFIRFSPSYIHLDALNDTKSCSVLMEDMMITFKMSDYGDDGDDDENDDDCNEFLFFQLFHWTLLLPLLPT